MEDSCYYNLFAFLLKKQRMWLYYLNGFNLSRRVYLRLWKFGYLGRDRDNRLCLENYIKCQVI